MHELKIEPAGEKTTYLPGEKIEGRTSWRVEKAPARAFLSLLWYTHGRGTTDSSVVQQLELNNPMYEDRREFSFQLPPAPYSFSGKLVSLSWALELVLEPGGDVRRLEFIMAPEAREISLLSDQPSQFS